MNTDEASEVCADVFSDLTRKGDFEAADELLLRVQWSDQHEQVWYAAVVATAWQKTELEHRAAFIQALKRKLQRSDPGLKRADLDRVFQPLC